MSFYTLIILCGIGTYLMRFLPFATGQQLSKDRGRLALFLGALGVAAMSALVMLSLAGLWQQSPTWAGGTRLVAGTAAVLATLKLTSNVGLATLAGAAIYGLLPY